MYIGLLWEPAQHKSAEGSCIHWRCVRTAGHSFTRKCTGTGYSFEVGSVACWNLLIPPLPYTSNMTLKAELLSLRYTFIRGTTCLHIKIRSQIEIILCTYTGLSSCKSHWRIFRCEEAATTAFKRSKAFLLFMFSSRWENSLQFRATHYFSLILNRDRMNCPTHCSQRSRSNARHLAQAAGAGICCSWPTMWKITLVGMKASHGELTLTHSL